MFAMLAQYIAGIADFRLPKTRQTGQHQVVVPFGGYKSGKLWTRCSTLSAWRAPYRSRPALHAKPLIKFRYWSGYEGGEAWGYHSHVGSNASLVVRLHQGGRVCTRHPRDSANVLGPSPR
jgi:hypothetical protein